VNNNARLFATMPHSWHRCDTGAAETGARYVLGVVVTSDMYPLASRALCNVGATVGPTRPRVVLVRRARRLRHTKARGAAAPRFSPDPTPLESSRSLRTDIDTAGDRSLVVVEQVRQTHGGPHDSKRRKGRLDLSLRRSSERRHRTARTRATSVNGTVWPAPPTPPVRGDVRA
jgi:hypothetical protein